MYTSSKRARVCIVLLVAAATVLFSSGYLFIIRAHGQTLYSVKHASEYLLPLFLQNVLSSLFPFLLLVLSAFSLKKAFWSVMCLAVNKKHQIGCIAALSGVLVIMAAIGMVCKREPVTVLYNLFYYLVLVAFTEEFVFRGFCACLLRDCSMPIRYLLPNVLFALAHIFAYNDFSALSMEFIGSFVFSNLLGLVAIGCLFQFLKEKTGTLWIPVLIHTICDFAGIFTTFS